MPYAIQYAKDVGDQLQTLTARERTIVFDAVEQQLVHQPNVETKNRKPMRPNPIATWELRIGNLRIYFTAQDEPDPIVTIFAIGKKVRDRVIIGNEEVEL